MKSRFLKCAGREMHVGLLGDESRPPLVMWHGLSHSGAVFTPLARTLSERYWIICPDTIGRGLSEWAQDPSEYCFDHYERQAVALLEQLGVRHCSWLGTSMGGVLGIRLAGGVLRGVIQDLLLNDIGPQIDVSIVVAAASDRQRDPRFATFDGFRSYIRGVYERLTHARLSQEAWSELATALVRRGDDGAFTIHHDPRITDQFLLGDAEFNQWPAFNRIPGKVGLIYGTESTILPGSMVRRMCDARDIAVLKVEQLGHAPFLETPEQLDFIQRFFAGA